MNQSKCYIRKDIISQGLSVPVGDININTNGALKYRWVDDDFYILYNNKWHLAESIDFEFN